MTNCKSIHIVADVPFDYLHEGDGGLSKEDAAGLASMLLDPAGGLTHTYEDLGYVDNDKGGRTSMWRLTIEGTEALSEGFLRRMALALKGCGKYAKLHIAEARDIEDMDGNCPWHYVVAPAELSGEAEHGDPPDDTGWAERAGVIRVQLPTP